MKRILYKKYLIYTHDFISTNIDNEDMYNGISDLDTSKKWLNYIKYQLENIILCNISTHNNIDLESMVNKISYGTNEAINGYKTYEEFLRKYKINKLLHEYNNKRNYFSYILRR